MSTTDTCNIYDLLGPPHKDPAYQRKYLHPIPKAEVVDRVQFILSQCKDKVVLNLGCAANKIHDAIKLVAKEVVGVDKCEPADVIMDFDATYSIKPFIPLQPELIVCGEILEHLSNPGMFLKHLRAFNTPVLITVPNAYSNVAARSALDGVENVNDDHVCWYSYKTMKTLLAREGFEIKEMYWYNGQPIFAEGMILVVQ